jgi:hypothetical protein
VAITWTLVDVLEQTDHFDKDERYMAINDLKEELQRDARIDSAMEKRVCDAVLSRLEKDTCNDVRAMAVQWWVCMRGCVVDLCGGSGGGGGVCVIVWTPVPTCVCACLL